MEQQSILQQSYRKIRSSVVLQVFAVLTLADYAAYVVATVLGVFTWTQSLLLFVFSAATWYFAVSWTPFWNEVMGERQSEWGRRIAEFVENFSLLALVLVHCLYTAILVLSLVGG